MNFKNLTKTAGTFMKSLASGTKAHAPEICVAVGIASGIAAVILAVKATPKAEKLIAEKKAELDTEKLPAKETVKTTWKCYLPAAALGLCSAGLIISGSKISLNRTAAMGALYTVSRDAFEDYKASVKENADDETVKKIEDRAAEKTAGRVPENVTVISGNSGEDLMIDSLSGRVFKSSINAVDAAVNIFNKRLRCDDMLSLNEWYDCIDLPDNGVGDMLYWHIERTGYLEVRYGATIRDGKPYIVVNYNTSPRYIEEF